MNTSNESSVVYYGTEDILRITSTTINLVLGVPVNGCILWLILTGAAGPLASEMFALNLSVCEVVYSSFTLVDAVTSMPLLFSYFIIGFLITGRPVFQCCICVERFVAVVHPVLFVKLKPLRYRAACSAAAWLLIVGASGAYVALGRREIKYYVYLGEFLLFMSVMLWCSLAILRALRRPGPGETTTGTGRDSSSSMKRRAFHIVCLIMVSFLGNYLIWAITLIYFAVRGPFAELELCTRVCIFVTMTIGLVQPLLYLCQKMGKLTCLKPVQGT